MPFTYELIGTLMITSAYLMSSPGHGNTASSNPLTRSGAITLGWIVASRISGAHFNPAVTFAVYLYEGKYKNHLAYTLICAFV